jgi:hypothetical protein
MLKKILVCLYRIFCRNIATEYPIQYCERTQGLALGLIDLGYPTGLSKHLQTLKMKIESLPPNREFHFREYTRVPTQSPVKTLLKSSLYEQPYVI